MLGHVWAAVCGLVLCTSGWCAALPAPTVTAELLADVAAVAPGQPFTLGIRLKISSGAHIYWINPGDAGAPTRVALTLPEGFAAGPVQYPLPQRLEEPGPVVCYGYTDTILLTVAVTPPRVLTTPSITVAAEASWLVCQDTCTPGTQKLQVTLPVATTAPPAHRELFAQAARWQPEAKAPAADVAQVHTALTSGAAPGQATARVDILWRRVGRHVEVFPAATEGLDLQAPRLGSHEERTEIEVNLRRLAGVKDPSASLPLLVVYQDATGQRRGFIVDVDVAALQRPPTK